ncbi:MAG: hypothetical protein HKP58_16150 [Desulfatitalea sp.]|nr:peptidylprolyl isomerase [Desulfatitalea sp.]NNK01945.1 hypothetical protein [Desulfatitalea sp.]
MFWYVRRPLLIICRLLTAGVTLFFTVETGWPAEPHLAYVNGQPISSKDLRLEIGLFQNEMNLRNRPVSYKTVEALDSQLLANLVSREVLYQHAKALHLKPRSHSVSEAYAELSTQFGGTSALKAFMNKAGITEAQLRSRLEKGLSVRRLLRREAIRKIRISESEMQAFYRNLPDFFQHGEQVRVRHILITDKEPGKEESRMTAWNRIQTLQAQLNAGADFSVLALKYSECPSRSKAGDLGYLTRDQLLPGFAQAAFELQPGDTSDIVTTRFGFHLIRMLDRKPQKQVTYRKALEKIERTLRRDKENQAVKRYVAQHLKQAEIRYQE